MQTTMRILIITAGSHGDVLPFLALATAFVQRGHEVFLYANPVFEPLITPVIQRTTAPGAAPTLRFVPVGTEDEYTTLLNAPETDPRAAMARVAASFAQHLRTGHRLLQSHVLPGQTLAIGGSAFLAYRLLRETDGVPTATVHLAPSAIESIARPARLTPDLPWLAGAPRWAIASLWWLMDATFTQQHFTRPLNRYRAELGLPPVRRLFRDWMQQADCVIGHFPDWFAPRAADWPSTLATTGFPLYDQGGEHALGPELLAFLRAGPPPVAFTAGTATASAAGFFATSIAAGQQAGLRAIVLTQRRSTLPAQLPPDVFHAPYAPYSALLPHLAALVHHGGIGTTSQALHAGVPQLIRPVAYDQFDNAQHALQLGVARELLPRRYTVAAVAACLRILVSDPHIRERCQAVRALSLRAEQHPAAAPSGPHNSTERTCDLILARCCPATPAPPPHPTHAPHAPA
jgi:rhamnosyltransferase subunit B